MTSPPVIEPSLADASAAERPPGEEWQIGCRFRPRSDSSFEHSHLRRARAEGCTLPLPQVMKRTVSFQLGLCAGDGALFFEPWTSASLGE